MWFHGLLRGEEGGYQGVCRVQRGVEGGVWRGEVWRDAEGLEGGVQKGAEECDGVEGYTGVCRVQTVEGCGGMQRVQRGVMQRSVGVHRVSP